MTQHTGNQDTSDSNGSTTQHAKEVAKDKTEPIRNKAGEYVDKTKSVMGQAETQARSTVAGQKDAAANQLHGVANALRQTSDQLREQEQGAFARYSNQAAHQIERASTYLEENNLDDLQHDAADFARRQPELFIGGAFTLGLFAARFLRSSAPGTGRSRPTNGNRAQNVHSNATPSSHLPEGGGRAHPRHTLQPTSERGAPVSSESEEGARS